MLNAFQKLIDIARELRGPNGCPWDQSRTLEALQEDFMEEAEEVRDALKSGDDKNLKEELGDTLFTIILMAIIAEEEGKFSMKDVMDDITKKLTERHTWVFGEDRDKVSTPEEALALWKQNKERERKAK